MKIKPLNIMLIATAFILALVLASAPAASAADAQRVLVLPFKMNAPQDTTYLQQGILDMLTSRLQWQDKVIVLPKADAKAAFSKAGGNIDEATARSMGKSLGADYVLFGSVTVVGESVSLDSAMIDVAGQQPPLTIYGQSSSMDGVIPKVNEFAENINSRIFQRGSNGGAASASAQAPSAMPAPTEAVPESRRHPDYLLSGVEGRNLSPLNPNFIAAVGADEREGSFWRSPSFPIALTGMDVGDVTGDGVQELVYASRTTVYVVRVQNGVFSKIGMWDGEKSDRILSVDVLDANKNGRAEIFISAQRNLNQNAVSAVLEFDGKRLAPIVKDSPYYFRVVQTPGGPMLMGQRSGQGERFSRGVYLMKWNGRDYTADTEFQLPEEYNIFNFAVGNLSGTDKQYLIGIDSWEKLVVGSRGGQEVWKSSDLYGMTNNYMEESRALENDRGFYEGEGPKQVFIPSRILLTDLDGDGVKEILVAKNDLAGSKLMKRWRSFENGSVLSLSLSQMALRENWRSQKLPGDVVDYQVKDYNNDGRPELIAAVVQEQGVGPTDGRSTIVAYELASSQEMQEARKKREGQ